MDLMAIDTSPACLDWGRFDTQKATLLLTVSYERHSGGGRIQSQREPHAWVAPKIFWLLFPTTVLSGSSVGAHK